MDAPWRVEAITYRLSSKGKKESEKKKKKQGHTGESSTTQTAFWKSIEYSIEKQEKKRFGRKEQKSPGGIPHVVPVPVCLVG